MATAVNKSTETTTPTNSQHRLLIASALGAAYVAIGVAAVTFGLPYLWKIGAADFVTRNLNSFFSYTALGILMVAAIVGLVLLGLKLAGSNPPDGIRAGVFTLLVGGLVWFLVTIGAGQLLERYLLKSADARTLGLALTAAIGVALLVAAVRYMLKPRFAELILKFDSQGWFRAQFYKPNQGQRVRRLTILGLLVIFGTGIWTLIEHNTLGATIEVPWKVRIPFLYFNNLQSYAHLLPNVTVLGPVLLGAAALWISWRAVNFPMFADFLIATEAEMNKVSWTTRKKLVQDTIVVLTTVVLFTLFLLAVDQTWGWVLSRDFIRIVPKAKTSDTADKTDPAEQDY